jgi:hypothetical protein
MQIAWFEYFQLISLAVAIYCRKGLKACSLSAFIPLLIIVNISELIGMNFRSFGWESNYNVYNVYLLLSTPFLFWLAGKMLFLTNRESLVFYTICTLVMLFVIVNFLFIQGKIGQFNTYSLGLIEIMMIVFSGLCLVRLTIVDQEEMNFLKEPYFWINSLNLLFGLITLVILSMQTYIAQNHIQIGHKSLNSAILQPLNAIVYAGYSYAFILCRTQKTR